MEDRSEKSGKEDMKEGTDPNKNGIKVVFFGIWQQQHVSMGGADSDSSRADRFVDKQKQNEDHLGADMPAMLQDPSVVYAAFSLLGVSSLPLLERGSEGTCLVE